jgi:hypothetical protein
MKSPRSIWSALVVIGFLASCSSMTRSSCDCVTRVANGGKGASLDVWVNFGIPDSGAPEGYVDEVAYAELTFLSIKGEQGAQVFVCNQHRLLTAIEIENLGPDVFAVPPGCAVNLQCASREHVSGGCEVKYRFRWLHK